MSVTLILALLLAAGPPVQTSPTRTTRLYVRTLPAGAEVQVDGQSLGHSDGLFLVPPGVRKVTAELDGFDGQTRQVEIRDGRITRVELTLQPAAASVPIPQPSPGDFSGDPFADESPTPIHWVADDRVYLGYVHDTSPRQQPLQEGAAIRFQRPTESNQLLGVEIFAGRADQDPAAEAELLVSVLDESLHVIHQTVTRVPEGLPRWSTLLFKPMMVPERFFIAITAQPKSSVSLGIDPEVPASHSYTGMPQQGLTALNEKADWMVRAVLAPPPREAEVR